MLDAVKGVPPVSVGQESALGVALWRSSTRDGLIKVALEPHLEE